MAIKRLVVILLVLILVFVTIDIVTIKSNEINQVNKTFGNNAIGYGNFYSIFKNILRCVDCSTGTMKWEYKTNEEVKEPPTLFDGMIYIGPDDTSFYCLNASTGKVKWTHKTKTKIKTPQFILDGLIHFGPDDNTFYCLNAKTGEVVWVYSPPNVINEYTFINSKLFVIYGFQTDPVDASSNPDACFVCIDTQTGLKLWEYKKESYFYYFSYKAFYKQYIYLGYYGYDSNDYTILKCLDVITGKIFWENRIEENVEYVIPYEGRLYIEKHHTLICLDAFTGSEYWKNSNFRVGHLFSDSFGHLLLNFKNNYIFINHSSNMLYLNSRTGNIIWQNKFLQGIWSNIVFSGECFYFISYEAFLYCYDYHTGLRLWEYRTQPKKYFDSEPILFDDKIYVYADKYLFCLDSKSGETLWEDVLDTNIDSFTISNGKIYGLIINNHLFCLDAKTGNKLWDFK